MKRTYMFFLLILLLINLTLAQNKGGRWQFENNGADSASWDMFDDTGVLIDTASYAQDAPLQEGTSYLWLDTTYSNNFMKIEDSDDLDFTDENIGLSAWIYLVQFSSTQFFISKGIQNTNPKTTNYALRISNSKNLQFLIRDSLNQAQTVTSSFTIPFNQWIFVAAYYDFSAHKVYMWNDPLANAVDTLDFEQSFFANDGPLGIGAWYADNEESPSVANFKGRIDDVRISGQKEDILPDAVTSLKYFEKNKITSFLLKQNYPNPFNPQTVISFYMAKAGNITLKIYDNGGRVVQTILKQHMTAGDHKLTWNADSRASGIYYYQLTKDEFTQTKKMLFIK